MYVQPNTFQRYLLAQSARRLTSEGAVHMVCRCTSGGVTPYAKRGITAYLLAFAHELRVFLQRRLIVSRACRYV